MKRTDRLMAILIALQQRPETARTLADKFEVSKRTVLRDMQSLSEMGIPLYSITGPKGGFRLMEGFQLPPLQLDSQEALTVLFALRAVARIADAPFKQARWTVMDKIKAVLPEQILKQVEPLLEYVEVEVPERKVKSPHLSSLLEYAADSKWLRVLYRSENHRRWLQLLPQKIFTAHGFWYCEAYSVMHEETRTFRVDRFEKVEVIDEAGEDLTKAVSHIKENAGETVKPLDANRGGPVMSSNASFRIAAKLTYRGALLAEQDYHIGELVKQVSDDEWEIDFTCPAGERAWAVRFFFSMGLHAEVIEPAFLREEIYELASQLSSRYRPNGQSSGG